MRLSDYTYYTSFNPTEGMWEVKTVQDDQWFGSFRDKAEAFQFCREMNE